MGESPAAAEVRARLRAVAVPERAAGQQAYMKSAMPYLGVTVPDARRVARDVARADGLGDTASAVSLARELWDGAGYREER